MKPIVLEAGLNNRYNEKFRKQFINQNRQQAEGLWRRTQNEVNADLSGYKSESDKRRRMIHFLDSYEIIKSENDTSVSFAITDVYLWLCSTLPRLELETYTKRLITVLDAAEWEKINENEYKKDGLQIKLQHYDEHPEDVEHNRHFPSDYKSLEVTLKSDGNNTSIEQKSHPWVVLNSGIREKGQRSDNCRMVDDFSELAEYFPAQFELGGGASIELGIPPLNHLHTVYHVTDPNDKTFVFGERDNLLIEVIRNPSEFYKKAGQPYLTSLLAEPNDFYTLLSDLQKDGLLVGDVITNNFDGLTSLAGLSEKYVRKYEDVHIKPDMKFHPEAKSLFVVGSHADRRKIQSAARDSGLNIVFIDPEKYVDYKGNTIDYPLEEVHDEDVVVNLKASEFASKLRKYLETKNNN